MSNSYNTFLDLANAYYQLVQIYILQKKTAAFKQRRLHGFQRKNGSNQVVQLKFLWRDRKTGMLKPSSQYLNL